MFALLAFALLAVDDQPAKLDPKVAEVIERSRSTTATYSVYHWVLIYPEGGEPTENFSAEFHQGRLHRVEAAHMRVVADCASMKGAALTLATGEIDRREWVAKAACGINMAKPILQSKSGGQVQTEFGRADRVFLADADNFRTYDVSPDGVLLYSRFYRHSGEPEVLGSAVAVSRAVPEGDIFSENSLRESIVPEQYKKKPKAASD